MKFSNFLQMLRHRSDADEDRGAVLAIVGIALTLVMISGALAVDLSALENRGQTLQNTADAAALAGVTTWVESGDPGLTQLVVNDVVSQNGLGNGDGVVAYTTFPSDTEVKVVIVDDDPDVMLGGVVGLGDKVERDATAEHEVCDLPCGSIIEIPPPFVAISAAGTGDGFIPIIVGDRFYAVNHHDDTIACVDKNTQAQCFSEQDAFPYTSGNPTTGMLSHAATIGTKIWYTGQENSRLRLFCWETTTDVPCPGAVTIADLPRAQYSFLYHYNGATYTYNHSVYKYYRGGGTVEVGGDIYVFTDDHRAHCIDPATSARCSGYPTSGKQTGLGQAGFLPLDPNKSTSGSNIDRIVDESKNWIYHTLQIDGSEPINYPGHNYYVDNWVEPTDWDRGIWLDCWDASGSGQPCAGFTPYKLHDSATKTQEGRLFFFRDSDGDETGVCSTGDGRNSISCVDLLGTPNSGGSMQGHLSVVDTQFPPSSLYGWHCADHGNYGGCSRHQRGMGVHMYHPPSNRVIFSSIREESKDFCFDFDDNSFCGELEGYANGYTYDYGFAYEGNCIFGLGHSTIFWSFGFNADTSNLEAECPGTGATAKIYKCQCGTTQRWPNPSLDVEVGPGTPYISFEIQLLDPSGAVVYPESGDWIDMVDHPTGSLNLSEVDTVHDYLDISISVVLDPDQPDPWRTGNPPEVILSVSELPNLTE